MLEIGRCSKLLDCSQLLTKVVIVRVGFQQVHAEDNSLGNSLLLFLALFLFLGDFSLPKAFPGSEMDSIN